MGFGNWFDFFFFKIMKKGSIVKGRLITGVLYCVEGDTVKVKYATHKHANILYTIANILINNIKIPTKKEKEEYKKVLLKNGYSYYRGKVTKEL